jgi:hypothetical protein
VPNVDAQRTMIVFVLGFQLRPRIIASEKGDSPDRQLARAAIAATPSAVRTQENK